MQQQRWTSALISVTGSWSRPPAGERSHSAWGGLWLGSTTPSSSSSSSSSPPPFILPSSSSPTGTVRGVTVRDRARGTWERGRRCTKRCFSPPPSSSFTWWALTTGNSSLRCSSCVYYTTCRLFIYTSSSSGCRSEPVCFPWPLSSPTLGCVQKFRRNGAFKRLHRAGQRACSLTLSHSVGLHQKDKNKPKAKRRGQSGVTGRKIGS